MEVDLVKVPGLLPAPEPNAIGLCVRDGLFHKLFLHFFVGRVSN